jgi:hypothetical protein
VQHLSVTSVGSVVLIWFQSCSGIRHSWERASSRTTCNVQQDIDKPVVYEPNGTMQTRAG